MNNQDEGSLPPALRLGLVAAGIIFGFFLINGVILMPLVLLFGWVCAAKTPGKSGDGLSCFMAGVTAMLFVFLLAFMWAVNGEKIF